MDRTSHTAPQRVQPRETRWQPARSGGTGAASASAARAWAVRSAMTPESSACRSTTAVRLVAAAASCSEAALSRRCGATPVGQTIDGIIEAYDSLCSAKLLN